MNLSRETYEIWFIDYLDGNLNAEQEAELHLFLIQNPDLEEELAMLSGESTLDADDSIRFEGKDQLKKNIVPSGAVTESNYEDFLVAAVEGLLSEEQQQALDAFLTANPELRKEKQLMDRSKATPDLTIVHPAPEELEKSIVAVEGIDTNNYEDFLVSAVEGSLSKEEQKALEAFLTANPDLRKEQRLMDHTKTTPDLSVVHPAPEELEKTIATVAGIDADNYEDFLVREVEQDLNEKETAALAAFLNANPGLRVEQTLMQQTKLQADVALVYVDKGVLKRRAIIPLYQQVLPYMAAAASIVLAILFFWPQDQIDPTLASTTGKSSDSANTEITTVGREFIKEESPQLAEETVATPTLEENITTTPVPSVVPDTEPAREALATTEQDEPQTTPKATAPEEHTPKKEIPLEELAPQEDIAYEEPVIKDTNSAPVVPDPITPALEEAGTTEAIAQVDPIQQPTPSRGRVLTVKEFLIKNVKKEILADKSPKPKTELEKGDAVALGSKGVNKLFGTNIKIEKIRNEKGEVKAWAFQSKNLEFKRRVRK